MNFINEIQNYLPVNEQETADRNVILDLISVYGQKLLSRENSAVHVSSSGFIVNQTLTKTLVIYHNIYKAWTWTGGHADGEPNLLNVALKEAMEETGLCQIRSLLEQPAVLDILNVPAHIKNGKYISTHLHISVGYLLVADENQPISIKADENSGVQWIMLSDLFKYCVEPEMAEVYHKLLNRLEKIKQSAIYVAEAGVVRQ